MTDPAAKPIPIGHLFVDTKAREEGGWVDNIDIAPGARVLTKSWFSEASKDFQAKLIAERQPQYIDGSPEFAAAQKEDRAGHARALDRLSTEEGRKLLAFLVSGWENLGGIPFTPENFKIICFKEEAQPFRNILVVAAQKIGSMRAEQDEAKLKNFVIGLGISFEEVTSTQTK